MRPLLAALALLVGLQPVLAQDAATPSASRAVERFERYLERRPYHPTAFEQMVSAAVEAGTLDALVERYAARVEGGEGSEADRVVLARLYARVERGAEALALLEAIGEDEAEPAAERHVLLAELHVAAGDPERALAALAEAAAAAGDDLDLLERVFRARGAAALAAGDREAAVAAYGDLADLDPSSFTLRLVAADALAEGGLPEAALDAYRLAVDLAGEDVARRCRALAAVGRVAERLDRPDEALAAYEDAIGRMRRGNWLRRDLLASVLALHERRGTLDELVAAETAAVEENPGDLDRREQLARAHLARRDVAAALDVLAAAAEAFPRDLELGRLRLSTLELARDVDGRVAEYQRLIEAFPEELELYLELGQVLASDGRLEQARVQWERSLERRIDDARLATRLAGFYAIHDMHAERARMIERAIAIEPAEIDRYSELAAALAADGRRDEVPAVLERARAAAGDDPSGLEMFAQLARELGETPLAIRALERALELRRDEPRVWMSLARLRAETDDVRGAEEAYRVVIDELPEPSARRDAIGRLVRLAQRARDIDGLRSRELKRVADAPEGAAPPGARLVLARIAATNGDGRGARKQLEALVAERPDDEFAVEVLADLLADLGRVRDAVARYETLIEARPNERPRYLRRIAELHLAAGDEDAAIEAWRASLEGRGANAAALVDAAAFYRRAEDERAARTALEEALRLRPDDAAARLTLAELLLESGQREKAEEQARIAAAAEDPARVDEAREFLHGLWTETGRVAEEISALRAELERNPFDDGPALALVDLWTRELEYSLALELLDTQLSFQPRARALLRERARLFEEMERWERARADYETLLRIAPESREELVTPLARCALELGDRELADRYLLGQPAREVARLYSKHGLGREALALLEAERERRPDDRGLLTDLARRYRGLGRLDDALALERRIVELSGDRADDLRRLARTLADLGRRDEALEVLREVVLAIPLPEELELGTDREKRRALTRAWARYSGALEEVHDLCMEADLEGRFVELARAILAQRPADRLLPGKAVLYSQWNDDQSLEAYEMVREVRAATVPRGISPAGIDLDRWTRMLDGLETALERQSPALAERRAKELETAEDATLTEEQIEELIALYRSQDQQAELRDLMERAVAAAPDEVRWRAGRAWYRMEAEDWSGAAEDLRVVVAERERRSFGDREQETEPSERDLKRLRSRTPGGDELDEAVLATIWRVQEGTRLGSPTWTVGRTPGAEEGRAALAICLGRTGGEAEVAEARTILAAFEPAHPELVVQAAALAEVYAALGWEADVERLAAGVEAVFERVHADPVLRERVRWRSAISDLMLTRAEHHERAGDVLRAYRLARRWGGAEQASLRVLRHGFDAFAPALEEGYVQARARHAGGEAGAEFELRDAAVLWSELLLAERRFDEASAVFESLGGLFPNDLGFTLARAEILDAAERSAEALALFEPFLELPEDSEVVLPSAVENPSRLVPQSLAGARPDEFTEEIRDADWYWEDGGWRSRVLVEVTNFAWRAGEYERAAEAFRELVDAGAGLESYVRWEFQRSWEARGRPPEALPLIRVFREKLPTEQQLVRMEGEALEGLDRKDEAEALYRAYLARNPGDSYVRHLLHQAGPATEPAEVEEPEATLEELAETVAADPRSARPRIELARRLLASARYDEALEHALEAERLAPHLDEAREVALSALGATRTDEGFEERALAWVERAKSDEERLGWAVLVADRAWARGDLARAEEALELARSIGAGGGVEDRSIGMWFLAVGDLERARKWLEQDLAVARSNSRGDVHDITRVLARLDLAEGRTDAVVEHLAGTLSPWGYFDESGGALGSVVDEVLRLGLAGPATADTRARIAAAAESLPSVERALIRAALHAAGAEFVDTERVLVELAARESARRELLVRAVDLARDRHDWRGALAHLEALADVRPPSDAAEFESPLGSFGERTLWFAERGALHVALGELDRAREIWDEGLEGESGRRLRALLAAELDLFDLGLAGEDLDPGAGRSGADLPGLLVQARLASAGGDLETELRWLEAALLLEEAQGQREALVERIVDAFRAADRLDEAAAWLAKRSAPSVAGPFVRARAQLALERGDLAAAREILADEALTADERRSALDAVLQLARSGGEATIVEEILRDLADSGDANQRRAHLTELAEELARRGRGSDAVATLRELHDRDKPGTFARRAVGLLERHELWADVLAYLAEGGDPLARDGRLRSAAAAAHAALGDVEAAAAELAEAVVASNASAAGLRAGPIRALLGSAAGRAAIAPFLEGDGAAAVRLRWLVQRERGHLEESVERALELAADPAHEKFVAGVLTDELVLAGRYAEALARVDEADVRNERVNAARGRPQPNVHSRLSEGPRLALALGDEPDAVTRASSLSRDRFLPRSATRLDLDGDVERADLDKLRELGLFERVAERTARLGLPVQRWAGLDGTALEVALRAGRVTADEAFAELWHRVNRPASFWGGERALDVAGHASRLLTLALEFGLEDALFARLDAALADEAPAAHRFALDDLRRDLALRTLRPERATAAPLDGASADSWRTYARLALWGGRPEEALAALDEADRRAPVRLLGGGEPLPVKRMPPPGSVRFGFGQRPRAGLIFSTVGSWSSFSSYAVRIPEGDRERDVLRVVALQRLGRGEEAAETEVDLGALLEAGLWPEAFALAESTAAELAPDAAAAVLLRAARGIGPAWTVGDGDDEFEGLVRRLEALVLDDPRVAWDRARLLAELGAGAERVRAAAAAAEALDPGRRPSRETRAWLALAAGRTDEARELFAAERDNRRARGASLASPHAGLALAAAAADDGDRAATLARRSLAEDRGSAVAARLRILAGG